MNEEAREKRPRRPRASRRSSSLLACRAAVESALGRLLSGLMPGESSTRNAFGAEPLEQRQLLDGLPLDPGINLTQVASDIQTTLNSAESQLGPLLNHPLPLVGNKLSSAVTTLNTLATELKNG